MTTKTSADEDGLTVACPTCLVAAGVRCTSLSHSGYKPIQKPHSARVNNVKPLAWHRSAGGEARSKCGRVVLSRFDAIAPYPGGWVVYIDRKPQGRGDGEAGTLAGAKSVAANLVAKRSLA